jgi:hypothetical protein
MPGGAAGATVQARTRLNLTRSLLPVLAALALAGCGDADVRREAARDVHGFLTAAQTGDRKAFRSYVDRPALRADLRRQLLAHQPGATFDDGAIDRMVEPDAFSIQGVIGLGARGVPGPGQIALMMRVEPDGRACLLEPGIPPNCVFTFARQGARWKLVAIDARDISIVRTRAR